MLKSQYSHISSIPYLIIRKETVIYWYIGWTCIMTLHKLKNHKSAHDRCLLSLLSLLSCARLQREVFKRDHFERRYGIHVPILSRLKFCRRHRIATLMYWETDRREYVSGLHAADIKYSKTNDVLHASWKRNAMSTPLTISARKWISRCLRWRACPIEENVPVVQWPRCLVSHGQWPRSAS